MSALLARYGTKTLFTTSYVRDSLSRIMQLSAHVNAAAQVVGSMTFPPI